MSLPRTINDHDDALAAEYALGTLPYDERITLEKRLNTDDSLQERVNWWANQFVPMSDEISPITPPSHIWTNIENRVFAKTPQQKISLWYRLGLWRGLTAALFATVIVLSALFLQSQLTDQSQQNAPIFVAQMVGDNSDLSVSALYNDTTRTLKLTRSAGKQAEDRDFELWVIPKGGKAISLGVLSEQEGTSIPIPEELHTAFESETVLAVTDEPKGGSPTGVATGAILAAGTLIKI